MSTLESIVPPLDLCREIPNGKFSGSALVWIFDYAEKDFRVEMRGNGGAPHFPAPTLAEIMTEIHELDIWAGRGIATGTVFFGDDGDTFCLIRTDIPKATEDALKLWLKLNGKKGVENG